MVASCGLVEVVVEDLHSKGGEEAFDALLQLGRRGSEGEEERRG